MNKSDPDDDCDSSCSFSRLPDDIVLQILTKLIDLKTLCFCKLVSRRFYSIVVQVDNISFTTTKDRYYEPSRISIYRFTRLKSLYLEKGGDDNGHLFKWKIKLGNSFDRFMFLSPRLILDKSNGVYVTGNDQEMNYRTVIGGSVEATWRLMTMFNHIVNLPLLEKISFTDSCKRGTIYLSNEKIAQVRNLLNLPSDENFSQKVARITMNHHKQIRFYTPLLDLPVSGYVMKGVSLYLMEKDDLRDDENDSFITIDDLEDREEAAYSEAMKKIWKIHKEGRIANDGVVYE